MLYDIPIGSVRFRIDRTHTMQANIERVGSRLLINFGFNAYLKDEIKAMAGAKYHGFDEPNPRKMWSVEDSVRNRFQLSYLMDLNPYAHYDKPLITFESRRRKPNGSPVPYAHQIETTAFTLTRRQCIIAEDMGIGKTLANIEAMEYAKDNLGIEKFIWVGPRSALDAAKYDFMKWRAKIVPLFYTYEEFKSTVKTGIGTPQFITFDEASRLKTATAQRTQAAKALADDMRDKYGLDAFVILMTGTPAPKSPDDWYSLCDIAHPGFIKEGSLHKFKNRLALIKSYESLTGGSFPKLITYWDDERKCKTCGKLKNDDDHDPINMTESFYHPFQPSINEVRKLYERMKGLVIVKMKDGLIDLPEKIFKVIKCKPSPSVLRASQLITRTAGSAIKALTLNRELSDGFNYKEVEKGTEVCPTCNGRLIIKMNVDLDNPTNPLDGESLARGHRALFDDETNLVTGYMEQPLRIGEREIDCTQCGGKGRVPHYERQAVRIDCPKETELINLLDQYEEQGRVIIWAGFSDSVERCVEACLKQNWPVIRLDGRGWWSNINGNTSNGVELLQIFDDKVNYPKIAYVGQPGAGGLGINLTASNVEIYYSNTFKLEDRLQSLERFHRPGADHVRGCMVIDLVHLPTDLYVLDNLNRKSDLLYMTMGQLKEAADKYEEIFERRV